MTYDITYVFAHGHQIDHYTKAVVGEWRASHDVQRDSLPAAATILNDILKVLVTVYRIVRAM
jgi:hypothetical protein